MAETSLEKAARHVAGQKALIAKQWELIRRLQEAQQPDALAMETLTAMERMLEVFRRDLERIRRFG